jgi:hypothetical protein
MPKGLAGHHAEWYRRSGYLSCFAANLSVELFLISANNFVYCGGLRRVHGAILGMTFSS